MLSVIVPVAPGEAMVPSCLRQLAELPEDFEILLVSTDERASDGRFQWLVSPAPGRAAALNHGASAASHDRLWFVHADTRLPPDAVPALLAAIERHPAALLYFGLDYYDGGLLHKVSAAGAMLRSRWFGAPFGDQAFCVPKALHELVGGFPSDASYGEDHLYARAVRAAGVPLAMVPAKVGTSARRHLEEGWLNLVLKYQWMWMTQALADRGGQRQ